MICKSCGAEYEDKLLVCPYCGSENENRAREEQLDYIEEVKEKIEEVRSQAPVKAAKRASDMVVKIVGAMIGVFLVVALAVWAYSTFSANGALKKQTKQIEKLEAFYQAQEFEKMSEFIEKEKLRGATFYKYIDIADLYDRVPYIMEEMDFCLDKVQRYELEANDVVWELMDGLYQLKHIYDYEQEGFIYGNEDAAAAIREIYIEKMTKVFLLTEEEIDHCLPEYVNEREENIEIAQIAAKRMNEEYR